MWMNDGQGLFSDSGQALGTTDSFAVALGDVDKDGDPDALVGAARESPDNKLYLNGLSAVYLPVVMSGE